MTRPSRVCKTKALEAMKRQVNGTCVNNGAGKRVLKAKPNGELGSDTGLTSAVVSTSNSASTSAMTVSPPIFEAPKVSSITQLPEDILIEIFGFIGVSHPSALLGLGEVCKRFWQIVQMHPLWVRYLQRLGVEAETASTSTRAKRSNVNLKKFRKKVVQEYRKRCDSCGGRARGLYKTLGASRVLPGRHLKRVCHGCIRRVFVQFCNSQGGLKKGKKSISKTRASSEYKIPLILLPTLLSYEAVQNPHYRNAAPMQLYNLASVKMLSSKFFYHLHSLIIY